MAVKTRRGPAAQGRPGQGAGSVLAGLMVQAGLARSNSEARRLVSQGAVELEGERQSDPALQLTPGPYLLKVGKRRFARVRIE